MSKSMMLLFAIHHFFVQFIPKVWWKGKKSVLVMHPELSEKDKKKCRKAIKRMS